MQGRSHEAAGPRPFFPHVIDITAGYRPGRDHRGGRATQKEGDMKSKEITIEPIADDGTFPNNEELPVLIYRRAIELAGSDPAGRLEEIFRGNAWGDSWRNGIYTYHHYHSTCHEVLGVAAGTARVQLGGEKGGVLDLEPGDVIVIPAGVAHKNLGSSREFLVVGAYPPGQRLDMNYGRPEERPQADRNIAATPLPETDPVHGHKGPLVEQWMAR